ncbi:MAG TPA: selenide, water dikinase SelD [Gemmatimonadaceae bacterium]|jgi:selenide,water dikinase|nr:selenide, water dikinase SelD [Gemmatimonadaceae bacterium]
MGPGDLVEALAPLARSADDERLLVGHNTFDDAGVFALTTDLALVQTVDFFAPIVDDPYIFGQIAAANALSDVFAMGGDPLTALCIVGFPSGRLPIDVLTEILRGGLDKVHEAGAHIVGGHTVIDEELKYGLAVTGTVHPAHMLTNATAVAGDVLVLTKPLGTGILTTAEKRGKLPAGALEPAITAMRALNAVASQAARALAARCATDVTGFGLLGHALHVAQASNVTLRFNVAAFPVFDSVRQAIADGISTGGAERNRSYVEPHVEWGSTSSVDRTLLVDPQTSGGLLVALPAAKVDDYLARVPGAAPVGEVISRRTHAITLA